MSRAHRSSPSGPGVAGGGRIAILGSLALAGLFDVPSMAQGSAAQDARPADVATALDQHPTPHRLIRRFDFEEAETARVEFPIHFSRRIAADRGFPEYGAVHLTRETAASGNWSFAFELDGGSLAAGIPTGVLPVLPLADYLITARVRTDGLEHARARVAAWFHDAWGRPIPESRVESPLLRTRGAWTSVALHLDGRHDDAADLVIELEILQPRQARPGDADPRRPDPVDVTGRACFDDLAIWHLPRIELATQSPSNVIVRPDLPIVEMLVRDLARETLTAELKVTDAAGATVFAEEFPAPRGPRPLTRELPITTCGWYRVELRIRVGDTIAGRDTLDFVVVPERRRGRENPLAVVLPSAAAPELAAMPALVRHLGVNSAVVPVWDAHMTKDTRAAHATALRDMIEALLLAELDVTFALDGVPGDLAGATGVDGDQVLELLNQPPAAWRGHLDQLLLDFGLRVSRWQLGRTDEPDAFWKADLPTLLSGAQESLAQFVPDPVIVVPFDATQEIPTEIDGRALHVVVPYEIEPGLLPDYATPWLAGSRDVLTTFAVLPDDIFTPRQQIADLLLRGLHAWRLGLPRMAIAAPWRWTSDGGSEPTPAYSAWRGFTESLGGRRFDGELRVADGVHCWFMKGRAEADSALVIWHEQSGHTPAPLRMLLAGGPVRVVDAFGNTTTVDRADGVHTIPIDELPVFVEEIDLPLCRFRAGLVIEPMVVSTEHQVQPAELVVRNPWNKPISGTIRLDEHPELDISPRRHDFALRPHDEIRLPLTVVQGRGIVAGPKFISADIRLIAEGEFELHTEFQLEVGWRNIDLRAGWSLARNARTGAAELIVTGHITNRGDEVVNLDAFLIAPGVRQTRRIIAALMPGTTVTRTFHLPGDPDTLGGTQIRVGVSERGGVARLNKALTIPRALERSAQAD